MGFKRLLRASWVYEGGPFEGSRRAVIGFLGLEFGDMWRVYAYNQLGHLFKEPP